MCYLFMQTTTRKNQTYSELNRLTLHDDVSASVDPAYVDIEARQLKDVERNYEVFNKIDQHDVCRQ